MVCIFFSKVDLWPMIESTKNIPSPDFPDRYHSVYGGKKEKKNKKMHMTLKTKLGREFHAKSLKN